MFFNYGEYAIILPNEFVTFKIKTMDKAKIITVHGNKITLFTKGLYDYISLTDIAKSRNNSEPFAIINNWMRSRSTIEFLGLWEKLCNPDFKPLEFERFNYAFLGIINT
jgi:hypothetical protein